MNLVPAFGPQFDSFVAAALTLFAMSCLLSVLPSVLVGVICACVMHYLNSFQAVMLGIGVAIAAYALCFLLSALQIFYYAGDETLIIVTVMVNVIVGVTGASVTWRICLVWSRRRQNRLT